MKRVTGLGGVFLKCDDQQKMNAWYTKHLGMEIGEYGGGFKWRDVDNPDQVGFTAWSTFAKDTTYFAPSDKPCMVNYRVDNLVELLRVLRSEGVEVVGEIQEYSYGKFGWIMDPEGNKIELWEPIDDGFGL